MSLLIEVGLCPLFVLKNLRKPKKKRLQQMSVALHKKTLRYTKINKYSLLVIINFFECSKEKFVTDLGNKKGVGMNERTREKFIKLNIKDVLSCSDVIGKTIRIDKQYIDITYQNSNLGRGTIPFFICPSCNKPRREMYLVSNKWKCYKCHDLVYSSQQRTKNNPRYWYDRAENEARKIDPDFRIRNLNDVFNHELHFPMFKPKNMKQSKFDTIRFWYGMYMFRGICVFSKSLGPARRFIEETRKNAKNIEKKLKEYHNH